LLYLGSGNIVGTFLNADVGVVATDIWAVLFFLLASLAGLMLVFRKKDIYDKSAYKPSIGGLQLVTVVGLIATVTNVWLLWRIALGWPWDFPTQYDIATGGGTWSAWVMTLVIIIVALILYYYYKSKGSRIGVDYSTIYAEIPPE
jgi:cbb3-type cytochrome oxidase subunit 3